MQYGNLFLGFHERLPSYRRSPQPPKENIPSTFLWILFALQDPDLAVQNQWGSMGIWIHNTRYSKKVLKRREKNLTSSGTAFSLIRIQNRFDLTPRIWRIQNIRFLAPPEKVILMPEELRPRVANDVFFSRSMASSSILVGPPDRLTWSNTKHFRCLVSNRIVWKHYSIYHW